MTELGQCEFRNWVTDARCPEMAVLEVTAGCRHEHVGTRQACAGHLRRLYSRDHAMCRFCFQGDASHFCPMIAPALTWETVAHYLRAE